MSLAVQRAEFFEEDFANQFTWYSNQADEDVAWRFQAALAESLRKLAQQPDLGRVRHFRHPKLHGLCSWPVEKPFDKILIFYRVERNSLHAVRLIHGARDLPRRLLEPPRAG